MLACDAKEASMNESDGCSQRSEAKKAKVNLQTTSIGEAIKAEKSGAELAAVELEGNQFKVRLIN